MTRVEKTRAVPCIGNAKRLKLLFDQLDRDPPGLSTLSTEHVQKHFTSRLSTELFALPAPFYKKRMYNQVQIDTTEVGEDAGMRGRAT